MMIRTRLTTQLRLALVLAAMLCCAGQARATPGDDVKELQIKAAFLLNFVRFTTWPEQSFANAGAPLVLGIVGDDPFGPVLEQTFHQQQVNGRGVELRRIRFPRRADARSSEQYETALAEVRRQVQQCHAAYMTGCDPATLQSVLDQIDTSALLTIGDRRECAERSTALALDRDGGRIVFCANIAVIERSKLKVSSKLLRLAKVIEGDARKITHRPGDIPFVACKPGSSAARRGAEFRLEDEGADA